MCPLDPSPHGGEILHQPPERKFPPPKRDDVPASQPDIDQRPALPDHPEQMAVDIEDEEADPVIDSGPGISK
ncbi:MAG: hypothetical protein EOO25_07840 [Comamonadaceae bacterium]|nr:MAG: hypothetical protein EOO25_07840 [Comamonadaceae bacterium]